MERSALFALSVYHKYAVCQGPMPHFRQYARTAFPPAPAGLISGWNLGIIKTERGRHPQDGDLLRLVSRSNRVALEAWRLLLFCVADHNDQRAQIRDGGDQSEKLDVLYHGITSGSRIFSPGIRLTAAAKRWARLQ